jgi:hypothetical protein
MWQSHVNGRNGRRLCICVGPSSGCWFMIGLRACVTAMAGATGTAAFVARASQRGRGISREGNRERGRQQLPSCRFLSGAAAGCQPDRYYDNRCGVLANVHVVRNSLGVVSLASS